MSFPVDYSSFRTGVRRMALENFRNYAHLELELSPGFNIVAGPNAQGKTNFLESIYLVSTTRLLRGSRDHEAIRTGATRAMVQASLLDLDTDLALCLEHGARKRGLLNGLKLPRASDLIGRLPCVCVSSADMALVRGEPADRRMFLDLEQSQLSGSYLRHFGLYKRALEQRNALLRSAREHDVPAASFEPWEAALAEHGSALRDLRRAYVSRLAPSAARHHAALSAGERLQVTYVARDEAEGPEGLLRALEAARRTDVDRGGTSVGPHRDDLELKVGEMDARLFGSQGQQRTAVIGLKLATLQLAAEDLRSPPLLLLDDILSDLDERRRALLVETVLEEAAQAVLTCTEAEAAGPEILRQAWVFDVDQGQITRR